MKAFVLAAGKSTRLGELAKHTPKVMLHVGQERVLERTLRQLKAAGVDDIIMNLHYLPQTIRDHFGDGRAYGMRIEYSHEPTIMGTAGGVKGMEHALREPFLVVYGDNVFDLDFRPFTEPVSYDEPACIAVFDRFRHANSGAAGGVIELDGDSRVRAFFEGAQRPEIPYVNGGLYTLHPRVLELIPKNTFYDFGKEVFPAMLQRGVPIKAHVIGPQEAIFGIDNPQYLARAQEYFLQLDEANVSGR